jgi:hypothetical protein
MSGPNLLPLTIARFVKPMTRAASPCARPRACSMVKSPGGKLSAPAPARVRATAPSRCALIRAPGGILAHSFANDDALACKDYVRERLGRRYSSEGDGPRGAPTQDMRGPRTRQQSR